MKGLRLLCSCRRLSYLPIFFLFAFSFLSAQQSVQIIDEDQLPIIGAEVFSDNLDFNAISDINGEFLLPNLSKDQKLTIQYLGYIKHTLSIQQIIELQYRVSLKVSSEQLDQIDIVGRNEINKEILPYQIESIGSQAIKMTQSQTSADALANNGDIFIQKSQLGGGSPVIRGFEANKVLLVVDGVRLNNAIYRNGHLQSAITVDQAILEEVEVLYGPNSLVYGSDALGGVVHFRSRDPKLSLEQDSILDFGNYYLRYGSANQEKSAHFDFNIGGEKWGTLTSLTVSDFNDLRMGSNRTDEYPDYGKRLNYVERVQGRDSILTNENENIQVGTGYSQLDILQKILFQPNESWRFNANFQLSTSTNIPRYDALIEPDGEGLRWSEWNYGPQKRKLFSLSAKHFEGERFYDKALYILSYQTINEERINRRFGRDIRSSQLERVKVWNFTADYDLSFGDRSQLLYGINLAYNDVNSTAFDENIVTNELDEQVLTRYPSSGSSTQNAGVYFQYHWMTTGRKGHLTTGLRYSWNGLRLAYDQNDPIAWPLDFVNGVNSNNQAISWALGWKQEINDDWLVSILSSSAFRAPNIDDIAKIRVNNGNITFPNLDLNPEKSINGEINISKRFKSEANRVTLSGTGFYTRLQDAIVRQDFVGLDGSRTFISGMDTFNIEANQNIQNADIYGLSINGQWQHKAGYSLKSSINWTKGRIIEGDSRLPLAHIPPIYGKVDLGIEKTKWMLHFITRFNAKKPLEEYGGSTDNPEYATSEGALSWYTLNLYGSLFIKEGMDISIGFENILDKHYIPFASGLSASGRHLSIRFSGSFSSFFPGKCNCD